MDRREERKSDAELLLSLLPHGAEFRKGRKKYAENDQIYFLLFFFNVKLFRKVLSGEIISPCTLCEKLWRSCAPDVRIVSLARAVFQLSARRTRAVLLRHVFGNFSFRCPHVRLFYF